MSDEKKNRENNADPENAEKTVRKKVWVRGKDGRYTPEYQERPAEKQEPEEAEGQRSDEGDYRGQRRERRPSQRPRTPRKERRDEARPEGFTAHHQIESVYSAHMSRSNPQRLLQTLGDTDITALVDVRPEETMYAPGLVKPRDLAILLKETTGIDYRRDEVLVPSSDLARRFGQDGNWHRFREAYLRQLQRNRVEEILDEAFFARNKVVFLGADRDPQKDVRGILIEYLNNVWKITSVHHL